MSPLNLNLGQVLELLWDPKGTPPNNVTFDSELHLDNRNGGGDIQNNKVVTYAQLRCFFRNKKERSITDHSMSDIFKERAFEVGACFQWQGRVAVC